MILKNIFFKLFACDKYFYHLCSVITLVITNIIKITRLKFRGQSKQTGAWLYGSLIRRGERCFILPFTGKMRAADTEVIPATVGQYTGLKDMHSAEIYEGDIIGGSNGSINGRYWPFQIIIEWDEAACGFNTPNWGYMDSTHFFEIKGNIHDNPELIEK